MARKPLSMLKILTLVALVVIASCASPATPPPESDEQPPPSPTIDRWTELLYLTPYPYSTPLPPAELTPVDGLYVRFDSREGERAPCRRCPPYPPEGGFWLLHLDRGMFRVYHQGTGWRTTGSFTLSGDRIALFNDPHCIDEVGLYLWELTDSELRLNLVSDNCGQELRYGNLTSSPWTTCPTEGTESQEPQPTPEGCLSTSLDP
jgi:hypothetical protein